MFTGSDEVDTLLPIDPARDEGGVTPAPPGARLSEAMLPESMPSETVPAKAVSAKAVPAKAMPANAVPPRAVPAKPVPSRGVSAQARLSQRVGPEGVLSREALSQGVLPQGVLPQAMAHGGTIIRPGAVAWGGSRDALDGGYSSCEAIERSLAEVARDARRFPDLLAELATAKLWVPLPVRRRPFTDGAAVRLPLVDWAGTDFVPCFTSVQRLTGWFEAAGASATRAGDARMVPHIVVPAAGLAGRLPSGFGLAINPGSAPGLPLYPECVPYLARLGALARPEAERDGQAGAGIPGVSVPPQDGPARGKQTADGPAPDRPAPDSSSPDRPRAAAPLAVAPVSLAPPPAEPSVLLEEARRALRGVPAAAAAARAWLSVPGHGEGLVIGVILDDPRSEPARRDVVVALERAVAAVPLHVPFPVDVSFPGEPVPGQPGPDVIADWMTRNTRPFYIRD
jgi:hypothetical protein